MVKFSDYVIASVLWSLSSLAYVLLFAQHLTLSEVSFSAFSLTVIGFLLWSRST